MVICLSSSTWRWDQPPKSDAPTTTYHSNLQTLAPDSFLPWLYSTQVELDLQKENTETPEWALSTLGIPVRTRSFLHACIHFASLAYDSFLCSWTDVT